MNRDKFQQVLQRYIAGKSTDEEKNLIDQWYQLLDDESLPDVTPDELNAIKYRTLSAIKVAQEESATPAVQRIAAYRKWPWMAAAAVAGILLISGYFWKVKKDAVTERYASTEINNLNEKINAGEHPLRIMLEDSSFVTLQPGAGLKYPTHFPSAKREVYMQGEAFFEISKNAARPFYVYNNNIITHVLGTSFNIRTDKRNNTIQVDVRTGKVEVLENRKLLSKKSGAEANGIILTPNQKVTYHETTGRFETSLSDNPILITPVNGNAQAIKIFIFDEAPLSDVLLTLERQYGIEIDAENKEMLKEPFTGDISRNDLFAKLDIVCKSLKICYDIKGTKIVIRVNGCN